MRSLRGAFAVGRRLGRSLGARVALFLSVALLPVGLIAVWQTLQVGQVARQRSEETLLALTERAAVNERQEIQRALGTAQALSGTIHTLIEVGQCDAELRQLVAVADRFSYAGYVAPSGKVTCASGDERYDFSGYQSFRESMADPRPRVNVNRQAPLSKTSVVIASYPVAAEDGGGFVFVSLPHERLGQTEVPPDLARSVELLTFNEAGDVLTSSEGLDGVEGRLPAGYPLTERVDRPPDVLTGPDRLGRTRAFAVVPILPGTVYVLGSWSDDAELASLLGPAVAPWLFPILMWAISLVVAYIAVHRLVIRHVRDLGQRMRAFADGRRQPPSALASRAPAEIAEMESDFAQMTDRVLREEAEIENRLHEQKVLLREVHHRVKNNLQLISSIINMQMRQIDSPEGRLVLRRIQDRVLGLATIHRNLYQTDAGTIRADVVLREIAHQLSLIGARSETEARLDLDLEPIELYPDQAVPLSLFVTEATTNAIKYLGRPVDGSRPWIAIALGRTEGGLVHVSIANSRGTPLRDPAQEEDGTGLGNQLIRAFAMQLDATPAIEDSPEAYRIAVRFAPSGFEGDGAEAQPAGDLQAAE